MDCVGFLKKFEGVLRFLESFFKCFKVKCFWMF